MTGKGSGIFDPDNRITRQELSVILFKAAKLVSNKAYNTSNTVQGFSDWKAVSSWAKDSMTFCVNNKILAGSNGKLSPGGYVSREQAIVMIVRLLQGISSNTLK